MFYMWAVHGHCLQLSDSFLSSDLRACAGLAGFPGPKSEFGRGGVRVHRREQQNPEKWIQAGAYPQSARALYSLRSCPCAPSFAGAQRQPKDHANRHRDERLGRFRRLCLCLWQAGRCAGTTLRVCLAQATALLCACFSCPDSVRSSQTQISPACPEQSGHTGSWLQQSLSYPP